MAIDTPDYLEAPDNEDSGLYCDCGEEVDDDGRYPDLCYNCNDEVMRDAYYEDLADRMADREMFPEDYEYYGD